MGPLCALQIYGIYHRCSWRHLTQVVICTCELYGGWMTFAPEWIEGSPNLDGSTFTLLWVRILLLPYIALVYCSTRSYILYSLLHTYIFIVYIYIYW